MTRSKKKGLYLNIKSLNMKKLITISKNSTILPNHLNKTFNIYSGNNFIKITVTKGMVYKKFGEFIFTRKSFSFKKRTKQ